REAAGLAASPPAKEGVGGDGTGEARDEAHEGSTTPEAVAAKAPPPTGPEGDIDRGLCVVCQDEEATLAVVDCGHLAMCQ
ncbi:RING finger protein, partial [Staphylococcus aureus]|uniref:RING finger protein n=1 Tax=Staphylococcus aureus TaxID=1280 RepID=UPI0021B11271